MICPDVERDLHAYLDREIDADAAAAVRDHLDGCPACRGRASRLDALGRAVRAVPYDPAPAGLRGRVAAGTATAGRPRRLLAWAAAAAIVGAAAAGLTLVRPAFARRDAVIEQAVDDHVRSLMDEHLFDVRSTDRHTVKPWFLGKLDFAPPVIDLAARGYPLAGGRLDYLDGRPAAALVYARRQHTINLFVLPAPDGASTAGVDARSIRGFHVRHWIGGGMAFWAVSDLNEAELDAFVRALQRPQTAGEPG